MWIILVISLIILIISIILFNKTHKINADIDRINNNLKNKNKELEFLNADLSTKNSILESRRETMRQAIDSLLLEEERVNLSINNLLETQSKIQSSQQETSRAAFENYCDVLDKAYQEKDKEWDELIKNLEDSYAAKQAELASNLDKEVELTSKEIEKVKAELDKIKQSRAAALEAQLREKEIEENSSFYCLNISQAELNDISIIETVIPKLNNPRILRMLIWQTYWQKPLKALAANVLGNKTVIGIYKITNTKTKECYIGQSVDIAKRFADHAKCGLGIDTPQGNKLYKAMMEYGIYSFSWELLEECPKEQLDEKEKYYIDLYDAYNYGYNSTKGNK